MSNPKPMPIIDGVRQPPRAWSHRCGPPQDGTPARAQQVAALAESTSFRAESSGSKAKVYVYAPIGGWFGVYADEFAEAVNALDVDEIELHVNSPGGAAWDGLAMMNVLRQHDAKVTAHVDGLAASAASILVLGADEIVMSLGSELMVHEASGLCWGTAADMTKTAEALDKLGDSMADVYARRAGGTRQDWRDVMLEETWYTAAEAVEAGLADRVDSDDDEAEDAQATAARWSNVLAFRHSGRDHAPAPKIPAAALAAAATRGVSAPGSTAPAASASGDTIIEGSTAVLTDAQMDALRQKLGVTDADADGDTLLAALDEALAEGDTEQAPQAAYTPPEGMELVDTEALAQMRADATAGRQARDEQVRAHRVQAVDAAVADGKIPPARRDHWVALLEADPGSEETLAALAPVFNTTEQGHSAGPELDTDEVLAVKVGWNDDQNEEA